MTAFELLAECRKRQILLTVDGENLNIDAPPTALTPELLGKLKDQKCDLLAILRQEEQRESTGKQDTPTANGQDFFDNCDELVDPPAACPKCQTLRLWQTLAGDWRCLKCDPPTRWREFVRKSRVLK